MHELERNLVRRTDTLNLAAGDHSQDRVWVEERANGLLALLADGAGGVAGGAEAAESFITYFSALENLNEANLASRFSTLDLRIHDDRQAGDTTGVVVAVEGRYLYGASVGDSEAWFLPAEGELVDLTCSQIRKPLLGSGSARAVRFSMQVETGLVLLCSDGLHKYANHQRVVARMRAGSPETLASDLANLARLPNGALQDDLSMVAISFSW